MEEIQGLMKYVLLYLQSSTVLSHHFRVYCKFHQISSNAIGNVGTPSAGEI